jgi:RNA polymerase sigma-70 factor (ECF subfamily)
MLANERAEHERRLRRAVLAGDENAWRALYDLASAPLWGYVSWRCAGLRDIAEDVTQETWLVAVRRLRDFDPAKASFVAWLRGVAANLLRNRFRQARREQTLRFDGSEIAPEATMQQEQAELIARALAMLPDRYEAVLRAKYLDRDTVDGIAAKRNESPKAIESLLSRARQAFRAAFVQLAGHEFAMDETEP